MYPNLKTVTIQTQDELKKIYPLILQLRDHLSLESFLILFKQANSANNYTLLAIEDKNEEYIAAMGYRIITDFIHGKHLYIDDLITNVNHRSKGIGAKLLEVASTIAADNKCNNLRLCTGIQNDAGKKFYEKNGWQLKAVVYKKKLQDI